MSEIKMVDLNALVAAPEALSWVEHNSHGRQGSRIHVLFRCETSGQQVALVQSVPGAFSHEHEHQGHETILVLKGSFEDQHGLHRQGELVHYAPGTRHSWTSAEGGIMYVVWGGPVQGVSMAEASA